MPKVIVKTATATVLASLLLIGCIIARPSGQAQPPRRSDSPPGRCGAKQQEKTGPRY